MIRVNGKEVTEQELAAFLKALEPEERKQVFKEMLAAMFATDTTSMTIILKDLSIH